MNGIHDMGGMHGFGPVARERDEPVFHADWERRTFAIALAMMSRRAFNVDEFRRTIEQMPPLHYLGATYYERWLHACKSLLIEKGVIERIEIDVVMEALRALPSPSAPVCASDQIAAEAGREVEPVAVAVARGAANGLHLDESFHPRFKAGDRVIARNLNPAGHTRMPRYVRGHRGIVDRDCGVFVFPDTHAHGLGANPQHCYSVQFEARELWGANRPAGDRICVDLWEDYLDGEVIAVAIDARPRANGSRKAVAPTPTNAHGGKPARKRTAKKPRNRKTPATNGQGIRHE